MWALIVAGHIIGTYQGQRACMNAASIHAAATGEQGQCMQQTPNQAPDPAVQYLGCVATGACR